MTTATHTVPDYSKMTQDELFAILCPPVPEITDNDVRLARARYVMDNFIDQMLTMANALKILQKQVAEGSSAEADEKKAEQDKRTVDYASSIAERFYDQLEKDVSDDGDPWDAFAEHFDKYHKDGLEMMHSGDCTAVPATCERCYAEQLFGLPFSGKWRGKAEGSRIWNSYLRAVQADKAKAANEGKQ